MFHYTEEENTIVLNVVTCGEVRFGRRVRGRNADREGGGRGWRRLGPGERAMSWEGDRQAGSLHGGLVVPQLMDPLLLQQQGLLLTHRLKNQTWDVTLPIVVRAFSSESHETRARILN